MIVGSGWGMLPDKVSLGQIGEHLFHFVVFQV